MAKIEINQFAGELPKMEPRYLPESYAASVDSARLTRGNLAPMRDNLVLDTLGADADKIYLWGSTFLSWTMDADAVPGPIAQDRLYITKASGTPDMIAGGVTYPMALPNPDESPSIANLGTPDADLAEDVIFAFTWVTSLGEESGPSPLSNSVLWSSPNVVRVTLPATVPSGRLITHRRIYRTQTSVSGATDLFYVAELLVAQTTYDHDVLTDPIATAITTSNNAPVPDELRGLIPLPNGIMAGFDGREVWFSDQYLPHSWPSDYVLTVNDDIVGLVAFASSIAVLTNGTPYVITGLTPDSMSMARLEVDYPCISKRGIVDMGYAAIYPSNDGLVQIGTNGASLISQAVWDREQWRALSPETIRAARYMGRYAMSYQPGATGNRGLIFLDASGQTPFLIPVTTDPFLDLCFNIATGRLIALQQADARTIVSFDDDAEAYGTYSWLSKPFFLPAPIGMGVLKVDAKATDGVVTDNFTAKVYRDGSLIRTVTSPAGFSRLPADKLGEEWQVEISGNMTVTKVTLASTPDELWQ